MAFGIGGKIKKGLGSIANKVADKLIPKELAPFLPMLAPLLMGPAAGIFGNTIGRYLMPQILTALSTGKTTGGISGTSQALTGLGSFLSDPGRFQLGEKQIAATEAIPGEGKPFIESVGQPSTATVASPDDLMYMGPTEGPLTATPNTMPARMPNPNYVAPIPGTPAATVPTFALPDDPTLMQRLKFGVNEARDFIQGTNVADKPFSKEKINIADDISASDLKKLNENMFDPYAGSDIARGPYKAGDPVMVRDAGFMQNVPRQAVQQGLQTLGPGLAVADKMKADAAAQAAAFQDSIDDYYGSRQALFDYFGNAKPNYGMLYGGGFADGGRIGAKDGRFFSSELLGANQISDEPMIGSPAPITDEEYILGMGVDPDSMKELGIGGLLQRILGLSGTRRLFNAFTGGDMERKANGGKINGAPGMPQGMQVDGRNGTFIPMGVKEKADDVPAMLSKNEFVMTADAVRAAGGGSVEKGAQRMYDLMNSLEAKV